MASLQLLDELREQQRALLAFQDAASALRRRAACPACAGARSTTHLPCGCFACAACELRDGSGGQRTCGLCHGAVHQRVELPFGEVSDLLRDLSQLAPPAPPGARRALEPGQAGSFFQRGFAHVAAPAALAAKIDDLLRRGGPADAFFDSPTAPGLCAAAEGGIAGYRQVPTNRRIVRSLRGFDLCGIGGGAAAMGDRKLSAMQRVTAALLGAGGAAGSGSQQGVAASLEGLAVAVLKEIVQACPGMEWKDVEPLVQYDQAEGASILTITSARAGGEGEASEGGGRKRKREGSSGGGEGGEMCPEHTDRGLITLVCSRERKGLVVRDALGRWVPAEGEGTPTLTVLAGHLLSRMSGNVIKAAKHAVLVDAQEGELSRLSLAFNLMPASREAVVMSVGEELRAGQVMDELSVSVNGRAVPGADAQGAAPSSPGHAVLAPEWQQASAAQAVNLQGTGAALSSGSPVAGVASPTGSPLSRNGAPPASSLSGAAPGSRSEGSPSAQAQPGIAQGAAAAGIASQPESQPTITFQIYYMVDGDMTTFKCRPTTVCARVFQAFCHKKGMPVESVLFVGPGGERMGVRAQQATIEQNGIEDDDRIICYRQEVGD